MRFTRTNYRQFQLEVLGPMPRLGEIFMITHDHGRQRYEVECLEVHDHLALVERTDDGPALPGARSAVLAESGAAHKRGHGRENHELGLATFRALEEERRAADCEVDLRCWCGDFIDDSGMCVNDPSHVVHPTVQRAVDEERNNWEQYRESQDVCDDSDFYDW